MLKHQTCEGLSYAYEEEAQLRSDTRKFNCENATRSEELSKSKSRLAAVREERKERRDELDGELCQLKTVLKDKLEALRKDQDMELEKDQDQEKLDKVLFDEEMKSLQKQRDDLQKQLLNQNEAHTKEELKLRDINLSLSRKIETISNDKVLQTAKEEELSAISSLLEQQRIRRTELEEHFELVDKNNAAKKREEDALQLVQALKTKAQALLDNGAAQLQKLYRGKRDRALVAKMKSSRKKGGKKGGKKGDKKGGKKK
jgi:hypothetical protein